MPTMFPSRRLDDPRDLRVLAALEAVGAGRSTVQLPAMSASFRDELRTQLVAVAPRLVAEGVRPGTETAPRAAASSRRTSTTKSAGVSRTPSRARTRPMTVLVAGAAVVVLGLGGATWLARGALPGDALYGLKRTAEGVDVSLSGSDLDKGHALLVGAQTRVQEVSDLIGRPQSMALGTGSTASGALSDSTIKLVVSTLATADTDTQKGVTTIGDDAVATGKTDGLALVAAWASKGTDGGQIGRIADLVTGIPSGQAHDSAVASKNNIDAAYKRAKELLPDIENKVTCARGRDEFGPQPCAATATKAPSVPTQPSTAPSTGTTKTNPGTGGSGSGTPTSAPTSGPAPSAPAPTATPTTTGPVASTPPTPAAVTIDGCGVQVSLPVVDVSLGTCTPSR